MGKSSFRTGFGLTCGIIAALGVVIILVICACVFFFALSDPTTQRVYQNVLDDAEARPTRHLAGPTATPVLLVFDGNGDGVVKFSVPKTGLWQIGAEHKGDSNFAVKLLNADGEMLDLLVNEIGLYEGVRASRLDGGRTYALEIAANGPWRVAIGEE